jgi:hypothetical protein
MAGSQKSIYKDNPAKKSRLPNGNKKQAGPGSY